jgi:hypothetical protein
MPPLVTRGIMIDAAKHAGVSIIPEDYEIGMTETT